MRRAESAQRGFLLTREARYLSDYNKAGPEAEKQLRDLRTLTDGDNERVSALAQIAKLMNAKFAEMDETIALARADNIDKARELLATGLGRSHMESLREQIETMIVTEGRLLDTRVVASQHNAQLLLITTLLGALLIVLTGSLSVYLMRRNIRQRERARQELAVTNANLERIVDFRTADLTEANDEIQRFAYIVSHDLRSPLVNIMGFTAELTALRQDIFARIQELEDKLSERDPEALAATTTTPPDALGKDFDEALSFITASIRKMDRLINAVLKLSREGRREFTPELVDMNELLQSISTTVAHRALEQDATVTIGALPRVESDRLALEQIFSNLIDNALKYEKPGQPNQIEVTGRATQTHVIYGVRDTGRGIDPKDHQRVFELFRRAGLQDRSGEGIGLAHVRALFRRLNGTLALKSELDQGSVFTVTLPRQWSGESRSAI
jgi:signal transduction histidine kinase